MNTTSELPPQDTDQKLDAIIQLVGEFRATLLERMDKLETDAKERYVDLRQRIERLDARMERMEQRFHTIDKNLDAHVRELLDVKDRMREIEDTRALH